MANNSLLLKESEINLLKLSNHIRNNESADIADIIFSNKKVYRNQFSHAIEKVIETKKDEWLAISSNEWQARKVKPIITNPSDDRKKWKRCSLCNTANKLEFYVVNKYNGGTINIGGTCSTNVVTGEMNELSKMIKNETAGSRYVDIMSEFPELRPVVFTPQKFINELVYELPIGLESEYKRRSGTVLRVLKKYLNCTDSIDDLKKELLKKLQSFQNLKSEIEMFQVKSKENKWALSKTIKISFQNQANSESIVSEIKRNEAKINKKIAMSITTAKFLNDYIKPSFNTNNNSIPIKIQSCFDNKIIFQYKNEFNSVYNFEIDSKQFIDSFGNIIFQNTNFEKGNLIKFFIEHANSIVPSDTETKTSLLSSIKYAILDSQKYTPYDFYGSFSDSLDEWHLKKFELLINNLNVYREYNNQTLYIFRNENKLISYAIIMLFQTLEVQEKTISRLMNTSERLTPREIFDELKLEVFKEKIF